MNNKIIKIFSKITLAIIVILPSVFLVTSCTPIEAESVINDLLPNVWVFLSHIFASLILFIIVLWLVWKPTKASLEKRHEHIASEIKKAENDRLEANKLLNEITKEKVDASFIAKDIIEQAKTESFDIKKQSKIEATIAAEKIKADAEKLIENNINNANKKLDDKVYDIAILAAQELIKSNACDDKQSAIEIIKQIKKDFEK